MDKFTALSRYALIAGSVGSGTKACLPPEGDWMTSVPRLHGATRGSRRDEGRRFRDAVAQRTRQLAPEVFLEPYAVSLAGRA